MDAAEDFEVPVITLNGVDFTQTNLAGLSNVVGVGGVTMSTTIPGETGNSFGDGSFSSDVDIFAVIASGVFGPGDVTFSGLTEGQTYQIQVFTNDARNGRNLNWVAAFSDGVNALTFENASFSRLSNRDVEDATIGEPGGDSITGTFVAGAGGTQTFSIEGSNDGATFNSTGRAQINGIQLRDITVTDVFETGDVNCDGSVDFLDIGPFIQALSGGDFVEKADVNGDGIVNFLDIAPFITLLAGG